MQDTAGHLTLFLAGDVMTGRGIDQILPHPGDPRLYEGYVRSATDYVELAERAHGPIPRRVPFSYVWGEALEDLDKRAPHLRIVNLETAITAQMTPAQKGIHYKMHPENTPVLTAARLDCCLTANNHVLDWGRQGLLDTLQALDEAGIAQAGAGRDAEETARPAALPFAQGRLLVFALGFPSSGVPAEWRAGPQEPGVDFLEAPGAGALDALTARVKAARRPGDRVMISLHWGDNWGYDIPRDHVAFARGLVERAGADIVFGHSSHHPRAMEVHRGKLIVYGAGDFLNDYEGIIGYEAYRDDLVLAWLPRLRVSDGALESLTLAPFRIRNFRLHRAARADAVWIADVMNREAGRFGARVSLADDGSLSLAWE